MNAIVIANYTRIPEWVQDLDSFRRWTRSDDFPERGRIVYLGNTIWIDPDMERDEHNQIKGEVLFVIRGLIRELRGGRYYGDGMRVVHPEAGLSHEPDGTFVSKDSLERQRVQLTQGGETIELLGSPDMVLEVVSPSSVEKDTVLLPDLYWKAGIREYWLIDPRQGGSRFDIFRHTVKGYVATRRQGGWLKSTVFGKSFRLVRQTDDLGLPEFTLEMR
jgi:Uma2 family endonuclease